MPLKKPKKLLNPIAEEQFKSGDIGFSSSNTWLAKMIRFFTSWQTGNATSSHMFIFVGENLIVEAVDKIRANPSSKYDKPGIIKTDVYRIPLTDEERKALRVLLMKRVGGAYGWGKIPLMALDGIATKILSFFGRKKPVFFFTRTFGISNIPVCSNLVIWAVHKVTNFRFRDKDGDTVNWKVVTPDYGEDIINLAINKAKRIYTKEFA